MFDPSEVATGVATEIVNKLWEMVERGLRYESAAQSLELAVKELSPVFEQIVELHRMVDLPPEEIECLKTIVNKMREACLKYSNLRWWQFCCKPNYQQKIEAVQRQVQDFILGQLQAQTARNVLKILNLLQTRTTDQTNNQIVQPQILMSDLETFLQSAVELDAPLAVKNKLRSDLMRDGGDQVLKLTGFAGSGKTTLAKQLCRDPLVRDWFDCNIFYASVGSEIKSHGYEIVAKQLKDELRDKGNNNNKAVLLVMDDVEIGSKELVEQCWNQISSNPKSKILVISRTDVAGLGSTPERMDPLGEKDAIQLLRHFVQPIGTTSYDFPDNHTPQQVVKACGGFPLAIKIIGSDLQGKAIEFWRKVSKELSQKGPSSLDTHSELLTLLKNSLKVLKEYESNSEFLKDLGLFPENQMIPVTALIDMWVELHQQDEEGIEAMMSIHKLTAMNLADNMVVRRRIGSDSDGYYGNHFLTQQKILRELANKISSEQGGVLERERLIIEVNGNDRPEWWSQQPQSCINDFLSWLTGSTRPRAAARVLSISIDQEVTPDWCNFQAADAEVLVLNLKTSRYTLSKFIKIMKNLRVLIVTNFGFRPTKLSNLELLGSLRSLKRIRLQQVSVPSFCHLKNVHKLSLYMCEVKKAFEDSSIEYSEAMPSLAEFNIEYCKDLVKLPPRLCNIVTLRRLNIRNCHKFTGLPQEVGNLEKLDELRIVCCAGFEEMPDSITKLKSLKFLDISYCVSFRKLPDNIGGLQNLTKLYMTGCPILEWPNSITNSEKLESVICDVYTHSLWEFINYDGLSTLKVETTSMGISLDWLFDLRFAGFFH